MALALYFTCDETDHISATIAGNALIEDARWSQYVKGFACWAERKPAFTPTGLYHVCSFFHLEQQRFLLPSWCAMSKVS